MSRTKLLKEAERHRKNEYPKIMPSETFQTVDWLLRPKLEVKWHVKNSANEGHFLETSDQVWEILIENKKPF